MRGRDRKKKQMDGIRITPQPSRKKNARDCERDGRDGSGEQQKGKEGRKGGKKGKEDKGTEDEGEVRNKERKEERK